MQEEKGRPIKHYSCLTKEEQTYYEGLSTQKRLYVDFRAEGYNRSDSYRMAGFVGNNPTQCAYNMEHRDAGLMELIEILQKDVKVKSIQKQDSKLNARIDALAKQAKTEEVLANIDEMDGETASRIKFYRDISNGKIKTKKTIKEYDREGNLIKTRVEESEDVGMKIQARKELDRALGLNKIVDIGKIDMGAITINIVDASNKEALEDQRNKVDIQVNNTEEDVVIDGDVIE